MRLVKRMIMRGFLAGKWQRQKLRDIGTNLKAVKRKGYSGDGAENGRRRRSEDFSRWIGFGAAECGNY
ncbi:hypothetical protein EAF00_006599 [Botryotinia globosa]|nr:hypothetical protein EAF00_006599 [Botryotinia globosa]